MVGAKRDCWKFEKLASWKDAEHGNDGMRKSWSKGDAWKTITRKIIRNTTIEPSASTPHLSCPTDPLPSSVKHHPGCRLRFGTGYALVQRSGVPIHGVWVFPRTRGSGQEIFRAPGGGRGFRASWFFRHGHECTSAGGCLGPCTAQSVFKDTFEHCAGFETRRLYADHHERGAKYHRRCRGSGVLPLAGRGPQNSIWASEPHGSWFFSVRGPKSGKVMSGWDMFWKIQIPIVPACICSRMALIKSTMTGTPIGVESYSRWF